MKYKAGDKVKVKENFWAIKSGVYLNDSKKKLAGRTLEVRCVYDNGDVYTKQDDSNNDTEWYWSKDWIELYTESSKEITWETLKWKDVVVNVNGKERMVLDVRNDLLDLSYRGDFDTHGSTFHKKELQKLGFTIKQPTPTPPEKLELTLDQVAEKFGVDVTNIEIKK